MQKLLLFIDKTSTWVGHLFSWFIVGLTLLVTWEVFSRYALDNPHAWAFDAMNMLYRTLFMMAGAYTLAKNGHVRGDVLYGFFTPRVQAGIDLVLYIGFFLPPEELGTRSTIGITALLTVSVLYQQLAAELPALAPPGLDFAYFLSSGSDAVEAELKLPRQHHVESGRPNKHKVIARTPGYHGNTLFALSASGRDD